MVDDPRGGQDLFKDTVSLLLLLLLLLLMIMMLMIIS